MRLVAIASMMFAIMIGVSKIAHVIRDAIIAKEASAILVEAAKPEKRSEAVIAKPGDQQAATKAEPDQRPLALKPIPVAVRPMAGAEGAPVVRLREALISGIQNELSRLGHYQGPIDGLWTRPVRAAVWKFAREANYGAPLVPGEELLHALQGASTPARPEMPAQAPQRADSAPRKRAQRFASAETTAVTVEATDAGGSYLPPWMDAARDTERDVSAAKNQLGRLSGIERSDDAGAASTEPKIASIEGTGARTASREDPIAYRRQRREASIPEHYYVRRRNVFRNANFAWPGQ